MSRLESIRARLSIGYLSSWNDRLKFDSMSQTRDLKFGNLESHHFRYQIPPIDEICIVNRQYYPPVEK